MKNNYPRAVTLRKRWVFVLVAGLVLILSVMLFNLNHAYVKSHQQRIHEETAPLTTANGEDTRWIKQAPLPAATPPQQKAAPTLPSQAAASAPTTASPTAVDNLPPATADGQPAVSKIYVLAANNNQQNSGKTAAANAPVSFGANPVTAPGSQGEKRAFLQAAQADDPDYLGTALKNPLSPYELKAGAILPAVLITGLNSDLPGQIVAQITQAIYDTPSGRYVLVPQGAKLIGLYDSQVVFGQERVLAVWKRIVFPNGQSIDLEGMPGVDLSGYAGFNDQVNNHYLKILSSVVLMSVLSAGAQLSQPQNSNNPWAGPTVNQTIAQSLGTQIANTGTTLVQKNINIPPTLTIRPGYLFNVMVTKDLVFPGVYVAGTTYATD